MVGISPAVSTRVSNSDCTPSSPASLAEYRRLAQAPHALEIGQVLERVGYLDARGAFTVEAVMLGAQV